MNILLLLAHAIEEHDQLKLLSELGYNCFSIGAYTTPSTPDVDIRPALPQVADYPGLREACHLKRVEHAQDKQILTLDGLRDPVDWAKADLPDEVIDWADVIICHHFEHTWIVPQWDRIKHKRVIWRTVGQSVEHNERMMALLRPAGLQVVRYSPKERNIPGYAGEDEVIRFYKDPEEWNGWNGKAVHVINFTQNLRQREPYTNWGFWAEATKGLKVVAGGPGSEVIDGLGEVSSAQMLRELQNARVYLYTGTQPASYTLGLIEAMMIGVPVVSIGPAWMGVFPYGPMLFEGHELAGLWSNSAALAHNQLAALLADMDLAQYRSQLQRERAISLFGKEKIGKEWASFLG